MWHRKPILLTFIGLLLFLGTSCVSRKPEPQIDLVQLLRALEDPSRNNSAPPPRHVSQQSPDAPDRPVSSGIPPRPQNSNDHNSEPVVSEGVLTIQPDALIQVTVQEDPGLGGSYIVNELGAIDLGYIGPVFLYNHTEHKAAEKIREVLLGRDFRQATVRVRILRASYDKIRVTGAVNRPGIIRLGAGDSISLNDALLRAGGLRQAVRGAQVRVVRDGLLSAVAASMEGDVYPLVNERGEPAVPDVRLRNNDLVTVFSRAQEAAVELGEKQVIVLGEVRRPGVYSFAPGEPCTMLHLLFKMGGLPQYANRRAVEIIRQDSDGREITITVDADRILRYGDPADDVPLENGDRIRVPARRLSLF